MRFLIPIILVYGFVTGCSVSVSNSASQGKPTNYTSCSLPKDQGRGSLRGKWAGLPVPIVFDQDFYVADNGDALTSLRNALGTWDSWAQLKGYSGAYSLRNDGSGTSGGLTIPALTDCSQASYSASTPGLVGVWKITNESSHANQRPSCGTASNGQPGKLMANGVQGQTDWIVQNGRIVGGSVLLNFADYNSPGQQAIDVESLLLHELGHVLGLLHSCNGSSGSSSDATTAPACFTGGVLIAPPLYANAVMFPFLQVDQQRRFLQQNDLGRINCLY